MKARFITVATFAVLCASIACAEEDNPIKVAMKFAHKAPKGEKKLNEKIVDGTANEEDVKKALELYKAMLDTKPSKGDQADFKKRVTKLIVATQEVIEKDPRGVADYKLAVNCKACHSEHKGD